MNVNRHVSHVLLFVICLITCSLHSESLAKTLCIIYSFSSVWVLTSVVGRRLLGPRFFMFFEFEKWVRRKEHVRKVCSLAPAQLLNFKKWGTK